MMFVKKAALLFLSLILFQGCSSVDQGPFCTQVFTTLLVSVETPSGAPAEDVDIKVTNKESGEVVPCDDFLCSRSGEGQYIIMHDGLSEDLSPSGETFIVEGTKDNLQFRQEFTFQPGTCHVAKVSGPDTVQLSEG